MSQCPHKTCFVPDTNCALGHTDVSECLQWRNRANPTSVEPETKEEVLLPWSGSALGLADLGFVSGGTRPFVVGIAGPQRAGKTTLLGAWYLLLGRGAVQLANREFAGSYSLAGWEAVSESMRWEPGHPPTFPPHTSSRAGRAPGLLHLSFWNANTAQSTDYVFTDAPGEWFQKWAVNRGSAEGAGAHWVGDRADVFLIVADRQALSGESRGSARNALRLLSRRIAEARRGQPVALVWTKSDVGIPEEIETAVREAVISVMPDAVEFSVSVVSGGNESDGPGLGLIELFQWTLSVQRSGFTLPAPVSSRNDPLFAFGAGSS